MVMVSVHKKKPNCWHNVVVVDKQFLYTSMWDHFWSEKDISSNYMVAGLDLTTQINQSINQSKHISIAPYKNEDS